MTVSEVNRNRREGYQCVVDPGRLQVAIPVNLTGIHRYYVFNFECCEQMPKGIIYIRILLR